MRRDFCSDYRLLWNSSFLVLWKEQLITLVSSLFTNFNFAVCIVYCDISFLFAPMDSRDPCYIHLFTSAFQVFKLFIKTLLWYNDLSSNRVIAGEDFPVVEVAY